MLTPLPARKYRDELRPRQGLLRTKEFLMKDMYTFDISEKAALDTYQSVRAAYRSFFDALGVPYVEVEASSGNMGGSLSHEYHFLSPLGEDTIVVCESCGFAANEEILEKKPEVQDDHQCPRCTGNKVSSHRAIEVGHTFHLGTRYTEPLNAFVTIPRTTQPEVKTAEDAIDQVEKIVSQDSSTDRVPLQMGCHGIGVSRLIGAVAAMTADERGLSWPPLMAPAHVAIVFDGPAPPEHPEHPGRTPDYGYISRRISGIGYTGCWGAVGGLDIVFDDRDKPLPWKLKDADLIGYPVIVVLGKNFIKTGEYEIQCRSSKQLSVSSKDLTLSVATMMNELTAEARAGRCWDILSSSKYMPKGQLTAWKGGNPSKVPAAGDNRGAVVVPGSDRSFDQDVSSIGRDKVKPGLDASPRLRKVMTACQTCGKRRMSAT
jgi:prolyl-tRNA synthetase